MNRILQFSIFIFWGTLLYAQNLVVDGVIFSADGSTLIKFPTDKFYKEYIIPEGTKIIGKKAFAEAWVETPEATYLSIVMYLLLCVFLYKVAMYVKAKKA